MADIRTVLTNYFLPGEFRAGEIKTVASWFIRLRWVAIAGFFVLSAFLSLVAPQIIPAKFLYAACFVILFYNFECFLILNQIHDSGRLSPFFIHLQVSLDWLALIVIIFVTGGIFSPFVFFFILHIIINAIMFPAWQCYLYTAFSMISLAGIFCAEYFFTVPAFMSWSALQPVKVSLNTALLAFPIYAFILFAATFLATSIMARFRQREAEVRCLSHKLQDNLQRRELLMDATQAMISSYEMKNILEIIVRESTAILHAQGAILRLVKPGEENLEEFACHGLSEQFVTSPFISKRMGVFPKSTEEIITVEDVETDPRISSRQNMLDEGIRSIISIPLAHKGAVMGDLCLYSDHRRTYSSDETSFLKILAGGSAIIIENARVRLELETKNKTILTFANRMCHDLRSPSDAVQGLLAVLSEGYMGPLSDKQKSTIDRCIRRLQNLHVLIQDILYLTIGKAPAQQKSFSEVDIGDIAREALQLLEGLFGEKRISVTCSIPEEALPFKESEGDMQRVFSNLLENALRYTPAGGSVSVDIQRAEAGIVITVKDNGIGIEPEEIDKIFDEFHRTIEAKKFAPEGTGLGLPIVKNILMRYNGFITVESHPGQGTVFCITLPL
jgi:K+-sensing histidine kinase KdpD